VVEEVQLLNMLLVVQVVLEDLELQLNQLQ